MTWVFLLMCLSLHDHSVHILWWRLLAGSCNMSQSSDHLKLIPWTGQWVNWTQTACTVTRLWLKGVLTLDQNLWGTLPAHCWIYSTKNLRQCWRLKDPTSTYVWFISDYWIVKYKSYSATIIFYKMFKSSHLTCCGGGSLPRLVRRLRMLLSDICRRADTGGILDSMLGSRVTSAFMSLRSSSSWFSTARPQEDTHTHNYTQNKWPHLCHMIPAPVVWFNEKRMSKGKCNKMFWMILFEKSRSNLQSLEKQINCGS